MSSQEAFYREQAAVARAGASAATLDNVRERWLLSENSWMELAERSERADKMRQKLIVEKANERAALHAAAEG